MKKSNKVVGAVCLVCACALSMIGCTQPHPTAGKNYTIAQVDLSKENNTFGDKYDELYEQYVIDNGSNYMAHPDTVLLKDGRLVTMYPEGHGKGAVLTKQSFDGGKTWGERLTDTPQSWKNSMETPTVYRLEFNDKSEKIVMISAFPRWWYADLNKTVPGDGFNASYSNDDGKTWTEFENFYGKNSKKYIQPIVAMSSLTRLKDSDGKWRDAWLGTFHDHNFVNYTSVLTFEGDKMLWSKPKEYLKKYRNIEKYAGICEVEIIRSEQGKGNQLCLLARSNGFKGKNNNSMICFSDDEGETWSKPTETPSAYSGERHKAEWLPDGRLFITFRSIERDQKKLELYHEKDSTKVWYSEGWIGWVGSYDDLVGGKEGQYRVKLAHTYLPWQDKAEVTASADTGYCGNAVLPDGIVFTSTYGTFDKDLTYIDAKTGDKKLKTFIVGKRLNMTLLDELALKIKK
ncbi:MAG: sialidase family protein [Clostridia bacterium]